MGEFQDTNRNAYFLLLISNILYKRNEIPHQSSVTTSVYLFIYLKPKCVIVQAVYAKIEKHALSQ